MRPTYSEPRVLECEWSSSQSGVFFPVVCPKESERETYLIRFGAEGSSLAKLPNPNPNPNPNPKTLTLP